MDFTGPTGGLAAMAFGAGCAAGYGFCAQVILGQFRKLWEERSTSLIGELAKSEEARIEANRHFRECEEELIELKVRVARLEANKEIEDAKRQASS